MNDSEPAVVQSTEPVAGRRKAAPHVNAWMLVAALAVALMVWQWFDTRRELNGMRDVIAERLQTADTEGRDTAAMAKNAQDSVREVQGKLGVLEARIAEAQGQQMALQQLYQELSRSRDESMLSEIEQTLSIASQQLQLAGNVQAALLGLQSADARLARSDRPQFIPLRRVIARDIERLKALPNVDLTGLVLKIDQVSAGIDRLPLVGDLRLPVPDTTPAGSENAWSRMGAVVWGEVKQLVRVERFDSGDPALLPPEQRYFLRENLKLRLLNARLALLQRNEPVFKSDLKTASQWITRYFDLHQKSVQAAGSTLQDLQSADLVVELPTLADSLAAVRNLKTASDK
jgi:uroporphyrin-3 C-methyltransferase